MKTKGKIYDAIRAEESRLIAMQREEMLKFAIEYAKGRKFLKIEEGIVSINAFMATSDQRETYVNVRTYLRRVFNTRMYIFMQSVGVA